MLHEKADRVHSSKHDNLPIIGQTAAVYSQNQTWLYSERIQHHLPLNNELVNYKRLKQIFFSGVISKLVQQHNL
jgi:hypothetical protein